MAFEGADGFTGEIRVGGRPAAVLNGWSLRPAGGERWTIRGHLTEVNDLFLSGGRPVEVRLALGKRFWRWTGCQLERDGIIATIAATGPWDNL